MFLQIGVFFPMILLKPFEPQNMQPGAAAAGNANATPSTSLQYKAIIMYILTEICRDGQLLVDLFVNFDCDLESSNLFERMVNGLVKVAQQPVQSQPPSPLIVDTSNTYQQETALRQEALQALTNLVEAMQHWYR